MGNSGIRNVLFCKKNNFKIDDTPVNALIECQVTQKWLQLVYSAINCMTFQGSSREEFIFGTDDKMLICCVLSLKCTYAKYDVKRKIFYTETL